jgi:hypothetical protein
MVAEERGEGGTARINAELAPPAVELIELQVIR